MAKCSMSEADIQAMVDRLHNSKPRHRQRSAYEQGGVMLSNDVTGWKKPGDGGKKYDF